MRIDRRAFGAWATGCLVAGPRPIAAQTPAESMQPRDGFLARPPAGEGPPVLVLHAWWGLNDTVRSYCTQLAGAG